MLNRLNERVLYKPINTRSMFWSEPRNVCYLSLVDLVLCNSAMHINLFRLYALVMCDHCPPPPPPMGMLRTLILCLQFPIVTTTLWGGQPACKTMTVLPQSMLSNCTAMVTFVYQTPTLPPHYGDNVKVKSQHI